MPAHIQVQRVHRSFKSVEKAEGMAGALQLLLRPKWKTVEALKEVSFEIQEGEFVGLIGANGAGKTTLLKILSGLIPPSGGDAKVLGYTPFQRALPFRKQIALVMGQKAQLWWDLPARDAFDLLQAIYEIPRDTYRSRVKQLSELLEVTDLLGTQIRRLSLGERMKMELIGAILHWPQVIFLDEPTIGLDIMAADRLRTFLKAHNREQHATIILTSHNMDDIERLCDRVMILKSGALIYDGKPEGLSGDVNTRLRIKTRAAVEIQDLVREAGLAADRVEAGESAEYFLDVTADEAPSVCQKVLRAFEVVEIGLEKEKLEDIIHHIYREGKQLQ